MQERGVPGRLAAERPWASSHDLNAAGVAAGGAPPAHGMAPFSYDAYDDASMYPGMLAKNKHVKNAARYKTELCRAFLEKGFCKYGEKCQVSYFGSAPFLPAPCPPDRPGSAAASLPMARASCAASSATPSTRRRCAAPSTARACARTARAATLSTRSTRWPAPRRT